MCSLLQIDRETTFEHGLVIDSPPPSANGSRNSGYYHSTSAAAASTTTGASSRPSSVPHKRSRAEQYYEQQQLYVSKYQAAPLMPRTNQTRLVYQIMRSRVSSRRFDAFCSKCDTRAILKEYACKFASDYNRDMRVLIVGAGPIGKTFLRRIKRNAGPSKIS